MRILLTTPIFPPDLGGPAVFVPSLGRWLVEQGHEVKVVAFCEDPNPTGYPFPVRAITRSSLPRRYLNSFFAILEEAKDVDVVYVQEHLSLLAVAAAKLRGKPCAVRVMVDGSWEIAHRYGWTNDDIDAFQAKSYGWKVGLTRFFQRWWWRQVNAVVCVSDYLRGIVAGHGIDPEKLHLIQNVYNGPAIFETTREEARERLGLPADRKVVVTVCRLMIWKGVDGLIESIARLPEDVCLVVVGDGDQLEPWTALAQERGVSDRVTFVGNRPHDETLLWIRAADIFTLNSRYEGLSHTLLEVMFLETPIICSSVCGNPELVAHEENGLLVPFNDVDALVGAVERLLGDGELARTYAERSKEKVKRFDRDRQFTRLENLLATLARGEKAPRSDDDGGCEASDPG